MPFNKSPKAFRTLIALQVLLLLFLLAKVGFTGLSLWSKSGATPATGKAGTVVGEIERKTGDQAVTRVDPDPELMKALQDKTQTLERRRLAVEQKEKDLSRIQMEIDGKINQLTQLQDRLKRVISEAKAVQDKKAQHLSEIFSAMPPDKAARTIEKMDDRTVTEVFQAMRSKEVGGILAHLDPARAARISGDLTRLGPQAH